MVAYIYLKIDNSRYIVKYFLIFHIFILNYYLTYEKYFKNKECKMYLPEEWNCGCLTECVVDVHGCGIGLLHNFVYSWWQSAGSSK